MTNGLYQMKHLIIEQIDTAIAKVEQEKSEVAIAHIVEAKELLHKLYYTIWHHHHTSGVVE